MLREIVRFAVPGCALAAAIWMLARYFAVLRPRAGTTEWIGRLTPPPWQPVSGCPLHGMDAPAALLLCLAVAGLRLLEHRLRFHAMPVTPEALLPVLFAGLAAGCAHLLLRRLLGGMLPALLCLHAALPPHGPRPVACADAPAESARRAGRGRARLVDGGARHAA